MLRYCVVNSNVGGSRRVQQRVKGSAGKAWSCLADAVIGTPTLSAVDVINFSKTINYCIL